MAAQLIHVVRHAHAGERGLTADDDLRPLSERGCEQAGRLAVALASPGPAAILSSPSLRCLATVLPLARAADLTLATLDVLYEGNDGQALLETLRRVKLSPLVACTHGDVIASLLSLLVESGVRLPEQRAEKASTWTLEVVDGAVRSARYAPPP